MRRWWFIRSVRLQPDHAETSPGMGTHLTTGMLVASLTFGTPLVMPGEAEAQFGGCYCQASFDAIDSDMRYLGRYYNSQFIDLPANACSQACDGWRREWFYWNACDVPTRINRGRNAWWGYDDGWFGIYEGPDTWYCPFPPP